MRMRWTLLLLALAACADDAGDGAYVQGDLPALPKPGTQQPVPGERVDGGRVDADASARLKRLAAVQPAVEGAQVAGGQAVVGLQRVAGVALGDDVEAAAGLVAARAQVRTCSGEGMSLSLFVVKVAGASVTGAVQGHSR